MIKPHFFPDELPCCFAKCPRASWPYLQLSRPHHFMAGVIPCLCGIQFSENATDLPYWYFIFILGAFCILGAGATLNDIIDRFIDTKYPKTMARPLPSGRVSLIAAISWFLIQLSIAFISWLALTNITKIMAVFSFLLICIYPYFKRYIKLTQIYLGLIAALPAIIPYYIFENKLTSGILCLVLALAMICIIFDTVFEYAELFSNPNSAVQSLAILFKKSPPKYLFFCCLLYAIFILAAGYFEHKNLVFYAFAVVSISFILKIISKTNFHIPDDCRNSFLAIQKANLIVFIGIVLSYFIKKQTFCVFIYNKLS